MLTFSLPVEPIPAREMLGTIRQTQQLQRLQSWRWCPSQRTKVNIENGKINSDCLKKCSKMPLDYLYKEIQQEHWSFKFEKIGNNGDNPSEWDKHVNFWHDLMHLFVLALQIETFRIEEGGDCKAEIHTLSYKVLRKCASRSRFRLRI